MFSKLFVGVVAIGCLTVFIAAEDSVVLHIDQGPIRGSRIKSFQKGIPFHSFTGIPYAKALNESTKFLPPEPPEPWSGEFRASSHGAECINFCHLRKRIIGKVDCLVLSVYTTDPQEGAGKAVMFWIHGGAFRSASGVRPLYGPDFLVEQDVVVVSINYRLGPLGFLSTEDAAMPGNVGLRDQVAALKWVQKNIHHFGGDPKRVTIFGESAGAASVHYHLMSPMSKGLFSAAIMQSGSALTPWTLTSNARETAFALGEKLGIITDDSVELVRMIQEIPTTRILEAFEQVNADIPCCTGPATPMATTVEPPGTDPIMIPDHPWTMVLSGNELDIPILIGANYDESAFVQNSDYIKFFPSQGSLDKDFDVYIPQTLNITDPTERKTVADAMQEFYIRGRPNNGYEMMEYSEMSTDIMFHSGIQLPLKFMNSHRKSPIFDYLFNFTAPRGFYKDMHFLGKGYKDTATHGDELGYLFYSKLLAHARVEPGSPRERVIRLMTKLWTNFAKTGNPTPTLDEDITVKWEPYGNEMNYVIITETLTLGRDMLAERMNFWRPLFNDVARKSGFDEVF